MIRGSFLVLGLALAMLFVLGLQRGSTPWLVWLDGFLALTAIVAAFVYPRRAPLPQVLLTPLVAALPFGVMWLAGLLTRSSSWLTWWNFVLACGLVLVTVIMAGSRAWGAGRLTRPV